MLMGAFARPGGIDGTVSGRIVEVATGAPVLGARVGYHEPGPGGDVVLGGGTSDALGHFSFRLSEGEWVLFVTAPPQFDDSYGVFDIDRPPPKFTILPGGRVDLGDVRIVLRPFEFVRGIVVTADGKPAGGATVKLIVAQEGLQPDRYGIIGDPSWGIEQVKAGADGRFEVSRGPGTHVTRLRAVYHGMRTVTDTLLDKIDKRRPVTLTVKPAPMATLVGQVLMPGGGPAADTMVDLQQLDGSHKPSRTGPDGRFRFEVWPGDSYIVYAGVGEELRYHSAPIRPKAGKETEIGDLTLVQGETFLDMKVIPPPDEKLVAPTCEFAPPYLESADFEVSSVGHVRVETIGPGDYHLRFWDQNAWAEVVVRSGRKGEIVQMRKGRPPWFPPERSR
jgi:hypothetical protein